jgi:hypothetical protein
MYDVSRQSHAKHRRQNHRDCVHTKRPRTARLRARRRRARASASSRQRRRDGARRAGRGRCRHGEPSNTRSERARRCTRRGADANNVALGLLKCRNKRQWGQRVPARTDERECVSVLTPGRPEDAFAAFWKLANVLPVGGALMAPTMPCKSGWGEQNVERRET